MQNSTLLHSYTVVHKKCSMPMPTCTPDSNTALSYSLTWYHLPSLHQKLPANLCCDWDLDLIPVLLPTFAVTLRLPPWSASGWNHTKGFTPQLKAQQIHRNTLHQVLLPSMLDDGTMAIAGLLAGVPRKRVESRYHTEVTTACSLLLAWQVTEHWATITIISRYKNITDV